MKRVHLVDCGLGNIQSVSNAFEALGCEIIKCSLPGHLDHAERIVLPGVGAFGSGIEKLRSCGIAGTLTGLVRSGARIFGICLGMQLLLDKSYEFGEFDGLGLIPGEVCKMDLGETGLRLPHIGWNDTFFLKDDILSAGLEDPASFYYVNSYSCLCSDRSDVVAEYEYGKKFTAIIRKGNVMGVQFHPEKSHKAGLRLLKSFLDN